MKVHFVLDEASSLGVFEPVAQALDKYRSYGIRLVLFYQSVGQLKECWPNGGEQTLMANTSQVFFAVNDKDTAEHVSTRLGEYTTIVDSGGVSGGGSRQFSRGEATLSSSWNQNTNWGLHGRKLLRPEEITTMNPRIAITFTAGTPPIMTWLPRYYEKSPNGNQWDTWLVAIVLFVCSMIFLKQAWGM